MRNLLQKGYLTCRSMYMYEKAQKFKTRRESKNFVLHFFVIFFAASPENIGFGEKERNIRGAF